MSGFVTQVGTTTPIVGALIAIVTGPQAGLSISTGGYGDYNLPQLTPGEFVIVCVTASGYNTQERSVTLDAHKQINFALTPVP